MLSAAKDLLLILHPTKKMPQLVEGLIFSETGIFVARAPSPANRLPG